jgi:hypothetical protein
VSAASGGRLRRAGSAPALVAVLVVALIAALVVLGEPNRPATATVVRPVVTVPALCSAPTVIDVAARDANRGLTAIGQLLGLEDELVGEAARDLRIVDTEAGTFFVLVRGDELRVAALSPAGLPIVNAEAASPQTFRAFALGALETRPSLVVGGPEGVFVVFGGAGTPAQVFALSPMTLASSVEVSVARDAGGPELADPEARAGSAVVHEGVLWLAGDDGRVVTFDPLADGPDRWTERADGLAAPLLAQGKARVHGIFSTTADGASVEVRSFRSEGAPEVTPIRTPVRAVTGVNYPASTRPVFAVATSSGDALLRPAGAATSLDPVDPIEGELLGLVATDDAAALLTVAAGGLRYTVVDPTGAALGTVEATAADRCVVGAWPDAAAAIAPSSAGPLLHLHDPSAPADCVVDTRDAAGLADLTARCRADGAWSIDKGSAPARDFTVEIGRALDELAADEFERDAEPAASGASVEAIQQELGAAGLGVVETEVDPAIAEECAAEEVTSVAPPVLDLAEPVGARAVRVEWSWSGGSCLPGRYLVTLCLLADGGGTACADTSEEEVVADPTSARSSLELPARPDRTYRVTVRAAKGEVVSEPSGALIVTTPAVTPDPPIDVTASLRDGTWRLAWSSCLAAGSCEQRPDGFLVTVEGCDGDGLGQLRQRFDASQRGTSFGADGAGFAGADLLGRRVQFRVATTSAERVSEPVAAGGCTDSVRPGRDTTAAGVGAVLSGRARQVTLAPLGGGRRYTELFGTARYDDVAARLVRGGTTTAARYGVQSRAVSFDVARCVTSGWAVELTPLLGGTELLAHRARLTDASVACDPTVDGETRITTTVTGSSAGGIDLRVTIPGLGQDVDNGLVTGVSGRATCQLAFGGSDTSSLAGGGIAGDEVTFTMPVPVVFDLRGACTVAPVVAFRSGGSAAPAPRRVDLDRAGAVIVDAVLPVAISRLERARTATYERRTGLPVVGGDRVVAVRHDGSGVPCSRTYGSSTWSFAVTGPLVHGCADGGHALDYGERDLDEGRGRFEVQVRLGGLAGLGSVTASTRSSIPLCQLPSGPQQPPCVPEPCEYDSTIPADDPGCFEPCEYDSTIPADSPECRPEEPPIELPDPDPPAGTPPADTGRRD